VSSKLSSQQEHESRAAIRLAPGQQKQHRWEKDRAEAQRVLRWLGSKNDVAPISAKPSLQAATSSLYVSRLVARIETAKLRRQRDRLQVLRLERARVLAELRNRDLLHGLRSKRHGRQWDRLLAYWRAAKQARENAKRRAPSKAEVHHVKLSTAPWTLAGGAVETNRRKH
jgi:hypothetical protein